MWEYSTNPVFSCGVRISTPPGVAGLGAVNDEPFVTLIDFVISILDITCVVHLLIGMCIVSRDFML